MLVVYLLGWGLSTQVGSNFDPNYTYFDALLSLALALISHGKICMWCDISSEDMVTTLSCLTNNWE